MDLAEPETVDLFGSSGEVFGPVGDGGRTIGGGGPQEPNEDHRPFRKGASEGDLLTGFFVPCKFGLLDEKRLRTIPAGDLDEIGVCGGLRDGQEHRQPPPSGSADGRPGELLPWK